MKKYVIGNMVSGVVSGITTYGVFLRIDDCYTGMIHISEISEKFVTDLQNLYMIGDIIESRIIAVDEEKKQLKLSIKQIEEKVIIDKSLNGFSPLRENLDIWIKKKKDNIKKANQ